MATANFLVSSLNKKHLDSVTILETQPMQQVLPPRPPIFMVVGTKYHNYFSKIMGLLINNDDLQK